MRHRRFHFLPPRSSPGQSARRVQPPWCRTACRRSPCIRVRPPWSDRRLLHRQKCRWPLRLRAWVTRFLSAQRSLPQEWPLSPGRQKRKKVPAHRHAPVPPRSPPARDRTCQDRRTLQESPLRSSPSRQFSATDPRRTVRLLRAPAALRRAGSCRPGTRAPDRAPGSGLRQIQNSWLPQYIHLRTLDCRAVRRRVKCESRVRAAFARINR